MNAVTRQRVLGLVGLGLRSRGAVVGVQQVRDAAIKGKLAYALVATDAATNSLDKVLPLLKAKGIRHVQDIPAAELGALAGRTATAVIGILDRNLARGIRALVESAPDDGAHRRGV